MASRLGALGAAGALAVTGAAITAWGTAGAQAATPGAQRQAALATAFVCKTGAANVTVDGDATMLGTPDLLTLQLGVQTEAPSAAAALRSNATKATALVSALEADGVPAKDLQTSGLSVQPLYNASGQKITGYQVSNMVTVTTSNLGGAGALIDDAANAAGNAIRVDNISFSLKDDTALSDQARAAAVRQAEGQAQLMATAAGMSLGHLCSLVDNSSVPTPLSFASGAPGRATAPSTPVQPGQEQVTANVTAVYELVAGPSAS